MTMPNPLEPLTDAERDVLTLAVAGLSNADIGNRLGGLAEDTIKSRMRRILQKLGAANRTHAVALLLQTEQKHCACCRRVGLVREGYRVARDRYPDNHPWAKMYDRFAEASRNTPEGQEG